MPPRFNPKQVHMLGLSGTVDIEPRPRRQKKVSEVGRLFPRSTRVLGLDLAAAVTGWALFDAGKFHSAGSITLPSTPRTRETRPMLLRRKFRMLFDDLKEILEELRPQIIAYEFPDQTRTFWSGGSKGREFVVARALGTAEGLLIAALTLLDIPDERVIAVPMSAAKRRMVGRSGSTSKGQVRDAVARAIGRGLVEQMTDDQSDACSIALAVLEDS